MTMLGDAWKSVRTIATVLDKTETNTRDIETLNARLEDARERLAALEAVVSLASAGALRLPRNRA